MNSDKDSMETHSIPWKFVIPIQVLVIATILVTIIFTELGAFPFDSTLGVYRFLPGNIVFDFIWLYVISLVVGIIVYFASSQVSVLLWRLHQLLTHKKYKYHIQELDAQPLSSPQPRRMILPAFVALGISYSVSNVQILSDMIFVSESFSGLATEAQTIVISMALLFILLLLSSFITFLFAPMWLMQDKGLICELEKTDRTLADIEGVGNWYLKLMKGFAGVSTIIAYLFTIFQTIEWYQFVLSSPPEGGFSMLIFLIPVGVVIVSPLLALGPISLVYVLYEKSRVRNLVLLSNHIEKNGLDTVRINLSTII
ncbi:MAG: hypothetical protein ACFFBJ_06385 [Promethearchaeota archaeon]